MIEIIITIATIAIVAKFLPSFILLSRFAYPNAKFSAIPYPYIKERELSRLLELKSLEEFKNNVVSRDFIIEGEDANEVQKSIDKALAKIITMAKSDSPRKVRKFYDVYLEKLDVDSIKKAVRNIVEEKELEEYIAFSEEGKKLLHDLKGVEKEEAEKILQQYGYEINFEMSIEEIEKEIDRKMMEKLLEVKLPNSCKKARDKFVKILIDVMNIKAILRGKYYGLKNIEKILIYNGWEISEWQMKELLKIDSIAEIISMLEGTSYMPFLRQAIVDFEKEGVVALERALDKYIIKAAREIANENPLGLGPGIRFIVEKEYEARNLKAIAKAIAEEMQEEAWKVLVVE